MHVTGAPQMLQKLACSRTGCPHGRCVGAGNGLVCSSAGTLRAATCDLTVGAAGAVTQIDRTRLCLVQVPMAQWAKIDLAEGWQSNPAGSGAKTHSRPARMDAESYSLPHHPGNAGDARAKVQLARAANAPQRGGAGPVRQRVTPPADQSIVQRSMHRSTCFAGGAIFVTLTRCRRGFPAKMHRSGY